MSKRGIVFIAVMTVVVAILSGLNKAAIDQAAGAPSPSPQIYVTATATLVPCRERVMANDNTMEHIEKGDIWVICYDYGFPGRTPTIDIIGTVPPTRAAEYTADAVETATAQAIHP